MEVDPVEKSPASSTSSFDFLPELMDPLKQVVFECFTNEDDPVQFIGKFNGLLNEGLVSVNQNPEAIIQALIEIGCAKNGTNALLMPYLDTLWECKYFDYIQYIKTLISYRNLDKPQCVLSFITKIGQLLKRIDCDFRDDKLVYEMCDIFMFVLKWYSDLLSAIFSQRREDAIFLVKAIEKHIGFFGEDHFARYVAFCVSFIDPDIFQQLHDQLFATCEQMHEMSKNVYIPKETKELMEQLPGFIKSLSTKPEFQVQYTDTYRFGYNQPRPAILSLVTVYSVFRVLSTNEEIADALINIGNINLMSKVQILTDLFRGTFLILLDYHEADEVSADQHRDIHTLVLTEIFAYKRLASIVELLLETGQCTTDQLIEALTKLASNSVLLNALDRRQLDNTLASIINNSRIPQFLGNEYYKKIMELRMHSMEKDTELFYLLYKNQNLDQDQRSRYYQFTKANAIAQKMQESPETIDQLIVELIDQAELMQIDLVLACLCADEQIKSFSAKLSSFILSLEHTGNDDNTLRNQTFDSAFLLLTRIRQLFSDLRLEEITDGNTDSTFYKWTEKLYDYLEQNHALPINEEIKQSTFVAHFSRLKLGQAFWNNTWDFSKLLDHAPAVGEAVLDEAVSENKVDDESLKSILKTFGDTSCMFICLCQWLETNPPSEHLQMLATSLQNVGVKFIEQFDKQLTHEFSRWVVTMQLVSPALNRLIRGPRTAVVHDIIYPYLVNCARRQIRSLDPMEIPAMQVLKNAFFYGTQQGWASPNVIVCIDRMIKHVKQVEWIQNWFQQMFTKQTNADELEIASELCLAAAMTKPPICFLCIIQKIIDENEFMNNVNSTIGFNHTWILARMLVKAMLIVCWADERWKDKRKNFKRWQMSRKRKAEDQSDESTKQAGSQEEGGDDETVIKTLKTVFLFFQKEIKPSLIRLRITFICFFMLELAMSPISEYRRRLIQMIPDGMIFALCRLEPTCFNLPVLLKIYDMDNAEHRQMCLQLACMLRKTYH